MSGIIDATYLPFTKKELEKHFTRGVDEQLGHFEKSADRYHQY
jgi:hypothetical protein